MKLIIAAAVALNAPFFVFVYAWAIRGLAEDHSALVLGLLVLNQLIGWVTIALLFDKQERRAGRL